MNQQPPQALLAQCEELSRNMGSALRKQRYLAEPYLADCELSEPDWRIRIVDEHSLVVCSHLQPEYCHWHTLMILLSARHDHGIQQFNAGKEAAVNKICENFKEIVK